MYNEEEYEEEIQEDCFNERDDELIDEAILERLEKINDYTFICNTKRDTEMFYSPSTGRFQESSKTKGYKTSHSENKESLIQKYLDNCVDKKECIENLKKVGLI